MTRQRKIVLDIMHQSPHPATAFEILHLVRAIDSHADYSTVCRTLNFLEEFGLISAYDAKNGGRRYQHSGHDGHPHFVCRQCGKTAEISQTGFTQSLQRAADASGFEIHQSAMAIPGLCHPCQIKTKQSASRHPRR